MTPPPAPRPTGVERLFTVFVGLILWVVCFSLTLYAIILLALGLSGLVGDLGGRAGLVAGGALLAVADFYAIRFSRRHVAFHWRRGW